MVLPVIADGTTGMSIHLLDNDGIVDGHEVLSSCLLDNVLERASGPSPIYLVHYVLLETARG